VAGGLVRHRGDAWVVGRGKRGIQGAARWVTTPELDRALMEFMQQGRHLGFWVGVARTLMWAVGHRVGDGAGAQAAGGGDAGGCVRPFSIGIWLVLAGRQG
jgi:hypothetical protein